MNQPQWVVVQVNSITPMYQMMPIAEWEQSGQGFRGACELLGTFNTEQEANAFFQRQKAERGSI
jgi:hypothetical protein